jgi:hypothetical protein
MQPAFEPACDEHAEALPGTRRQGPEAPRQVDRQLDREHHRGLRHGDAIGMLLGRFHIPPGLARRNAVPAGSCDCGGGVVSPLLANMFLHLAFDDWMRQTHPGVPFERYADDIVAHCKTEEQAQQVLESITRRLEHCRLEVHPEKTRIVYCKDGDRTGRHPNVGFESLGTRSGLAGPRIDGGSSS